MNDIKKSHRSVNPEQFNNPVKLPSAEPVNINPTPTQPHTTMNFLKRAFTKSILPFIRQNIDIDIESLQPGVLSIKVSMAGIEIVNRIIHY